MGGSPFRTAITMLVALVVLGAGGIYLVRQATQGSPPVQGEAEFRAASELIAKGPGQAFGNDARAEELAGKLRAALLEETAELDQDPADVRVFAQVGPSAACFLVRVPGLKQLSEPERERLLGALYERARALLASPELPLTVATRGKLFYGGVAQGEGPGSPRVTVGGAIVVETLFPAFAPGS
jgi:hypothetical protein